jgi:hypothetical protein
MQKKCFFRWPPLTVRLSIEVSIHAEPNSLQPRAPRPWIEARYRVYLTGTKSGVGRVATAPRSGSRAEAMFCRFHAVAAERWGTVMPLDIRLEADFGRSDALRDVATWVRPRSLFITRLETSLARVVRRFLA